MTQVMCPHCGKAGQVKIELTSGVSIKCPRCGVRFTPTMTEKSLSPSKEINDRKANSTGSRKLRSLLLLCSVSIGSFLIGKFSDNLIALYPIDRTPVEIREQVNLVRKYLNVEDWHDRLPLIRKPDLYKDAMKERYSNFTPSKNATVKPNEVKSKSSISEKLDCSWFGVHYPAFNGLPEEDGWVVLVKRDNKWLVDWCATTSYNPITLKDFVTSPDRSVRRFRVGVSLSDYYNYQYTNEKPYHLSFELNDNSGLRVYAYVLRDSPAGIKMKEIFKGIGHEIAFVLDVRHTLESDIRTEPNSADANHVEIVNLVSDTAIEPLND